MLDVKEKSRRKIYGLKPHQFNLVFNVDIVKFKNKEKKKNCDTNRSSLEIIIV